ncbi:hypothetical protein BU15DRAFT_74268 [Melanogaster broomeanus]|nr:hypothetical protein BU15DRAFT_74268 [Melanogaster broomeanus]
MSTNRDHPSEVRGNTQPEPTESSTQGGNYTDDPSLPPQRHAGAAGLGPNYAFEASLGEKVSGLMEEIKGKILKEPALVEHGRERRTGELKRKQRALDNAGDPFSTPS